jgi:SulP family sulfate permease
MRHVPFIDSTGLHNLKDALEILAESKTQIILSGVNETVSKDLENNGIVNLVGQNRIYSTFDLAVEGAKKILNSKK